MRFCLGACGRVCLILLAGGCSDRGGNRVGAEPSTQESAKQEISRQTGLELPAACRVLVAGDGGGREPSLGYYYWSLFSGAPIALPALDEPGVHGELPLPLSDTVAFVQGKMGCQPIEDAIQASGTGWETNGFEFRGTTVRSVNGDYLVIERFRKR